MAREKASAWTPEVIMQLVLSLFPLILELIKLLQNQGVTPAQARKLNKVLSKVEQIPAF